MTNIYFCFLTDSKANPIDIFAIGFEEMVELNAGNIVSARYVFKILPINNLQLVNNGLNIFQL